MSSTVWSGWPNPSQVEATENITIDTGGVKKVIQTMKDDIS
jgi:hypothetical protein